MAKGVGQIEKENRKNDQEHRDRKGIFDGIKWMESQCIFLGFLRNTNRIVLTDMMQRPNMQTHQCRKNKWKQIMQGKEAV